MENLNKIIELAQEAKHNGEKLYENNVKKYSTETRNTLMEIKKLCGVARKEANEYKKQMTKKIRKKKIKTDDKE